MKETGFFATRTSTAGLFSAAGFFAWIGFGLLSALDSMGPTTVRTLSELSTKGVWLFMAAGVAYAIMLKLDEVLRLLEEKD